MKVMFTIFPKKRLGKHLLTPNWGKKIFVEIDLCPNKILTLQLLSLISLFA